jgi:magnesium transporter
MILGTLLIAGGAVLVAIFGIVPEPTHSLEDLLELFARPPFVAYFTLLGVAVLACLAIVSRVHSISAVSLICKVVQTHLAEYSYLRRLRGLPPSRPSSPLLISTNSTLDLNERTPLLDRKRNPASSAASIASASSSAA